MRKLLGGQAPPHITDRAAQGDRGSFNLVYYGSSVLFYCNPSHGSAAAHSQKMERSLQDITFELLLSSTNEGRGSSLGPWPAKRTTFR